MHPFLALCSLVIFATVAQTLVPVPIYPPFLPCRQRWDCENNCTREKEALDHCCSNSLGLFNPPALQNSEAKPCSYACASFEGTYQKCLEYCTPKNNSCPPDLTMDKSFCDKACKHNNRQSEEKDPCFYMSSVTVLCRPLCQNDRDCPGDQKCCPSACASSCQKPVESP